MSLDGGEKVMKKKWIVVTLLLVDVFLMNAIFFHFKLDFSARSESERSSVENNTESPVQSPESGTSNTKAAKANKEMTSLSIDELRSTVSSTFKGLFYKIGDQGPVEYLNKYLPENGGSDMINWLKPTTNYITTPAFLLNDSTSQLDINDPNYKDMFMAFLPELFEIEEDGIYLIDNNGTNFVYIKTDTQSMPTYIDYVFKGDNSNINLYKMTSEADDVVYVEKEPAYEIYPVSDFYHEATKTGAVFNGYFYNIDHSKPDVFLKNGPQTTNNTNQSDLNQFNNEKNLSTLIQIFKYISEDQYHNGDGEKFGRTVDDIMSSKLLTGCTDYGLLFASLARDKGIPTIFLQTARIDWIYDRVRNADSGITGHILIEVYIDGKWRLVDSTAGRYYPDYDFSNFSLNDGYYVFSKSIEVWDSGVKNEQQNTSMMNDLFKNFNVDAYIDPVHDYIDLRTGRSVKGTPFNFGQQTVTKASDAN